MLIIRRRTVAAIAVVGVALAGLSGSSWATTARKHVAATVHAAHKVALHGKKPLRSGLGNRPSKFASSKPVAAIHGEDVVPGEMPVETASLEAAPNQAAPVEIASNQSEAVPAMSIQAAPSQGIVSKPAQNEDAPVTVSKVDGKPYTLRMSNLHTGETLEIVYRIGNTYIPDALAKLNYFLRDHNTQDVVDYSPKEFDVLHAMMSRLGKVNGLIDIVCGYRTPETNAALRQNSPWTGVAEHSQHMEGHAIDLRVPGVTTAQLRNAALSLKAGGVGYYPISQFVHIDVGPVREWVHGGRQVASRHRSRRSRVSNGM